MFSNRNAMPRGYKINMDYKEALEYYNSLNARGMKFGLDRIRLLMNYLSDPDKVLRIIHVAGTNGKGSVIAFTSSILSKAGYQVGAYTSPHLLRINETIRIGNENISDSDFARIIFEIKSVTESNQDLKDAELSSFEILTVVAMQYFKENKCDFVLLEVGLGGRLDATNVITYPLISVITKIAYDHVGILGHDIESITREKAGIIKGNSMVVLSTQDYNGALEIVKERCSSLNSQLIQVDRNNVKIKNSTCSTFEQVFNYKHLKNIKISLLGTHQIFNAATAIEIIFALAKYGFNINEKDIFNGLKDAYWPCRLELIRTNPMIIIDAAHNVDGVEALVDYLTLVAPKNKKITFIFGVLKDKNYIEMIEKIVPLAQNIITVTPNNSRALEATELAEIISGYGITAIASNNIEEAVKLGIAQAKQDSVICIFGSLFYVGEAREILVGM
jgi:dihydrofolate synthase/folylpolyglutamate synthase